MPTMQSISLQAEQIYWETQTGQQTGQFRELSRMTLLAAAEDKAGDGSSGRREGGDVQH